MTLSVFTALTVDVIYTGFSFEARGRTFRPVVCHSTSGTLRSTLAFFFYYCIIYFSY